MICGVPAGGSRGSSEPMPQGSGTSTAREEPSTAPGDLVTGALKEGVSVAHRDGRTAPPRRGILQRRSRMKLGASAVGVAMACTTLAACASSSAATGPVTLNFYSFADNSGAVQTAVDQLQQQHGKYTINYNKLPTAADGQRQQLVRRLAARTARSTSSASTSPGRPSSPRPAGSSRGPAANKSRPRHGTLKVPLETAHLEGQALRGSLQQQHPAALVPRRPRASPADHLGPR